jgi:hypothetical protein
MGLRRIKQHDTPSRIFCYGSDGLVSIISPRTGEKLITGGPFSARPCVLDAVYDAVLGRIYFLCEESKVIVNSAVRSQCTELEVWEVSRIFTLNF